MSYQGSARSEATIQDTIVLHVIVLGCSCKDVLVYVPGLLGKVIVYYYSHDVLLIPMHPSVQVTVKRTAGFSLNKTFDFGKPFDWRLGQCSS